MLVGPTLYKFIKAIEQNGPIGTIQLSEITGLRREDTQTYAVRAFRLGLVTKEAIKSAETGRKNFIYSVITDWEDSIQKRGHGEPRVLAMPASIKRSMPKVIINSVWALGNL